MDAYTKELLGMAIEACPNHRVEVGRGPDEWWVESGGSGECIFAVTLADALASLLRDLGVEVPERPTAERRDEVWQHLNEAEHNGEFLDGMRDYSDRLAVLALLEEGS